MDRKLGGYPIFRIISTLHAQQILVHYNLTECMAYTIYIYALTLFYTVSLRFVLHALPR